MEGELFTISGTTEIYRVGPYPFPLANPLSLFTGILRYLQLYTLYAFYMYTLIHSVVLFVLFYVASGIYSSIQSISLLHVCIHPMYSFSFPFDFRSRIRYSLLSLRPCFILNFRSRIRFVYIFSCFFYLNPPFPRREKVFCMDLRRAHSHLTKSATIDLTTFYSNTNRLSHLSSVIMNNNSNEC